MKSNVSVIDLLYKDQEVWVKMANSIITSKKIDAKDLIHDLYLLIYTKVDNEKIELKRIMIDNEINKAYIYTVLKNLYHDQIKKLSVVDELETNKLAIIENDNDIQLMESRIDEIVNTFYWFDKKLFNLYRTKHKTIRSLSKATRISHVVVHRTIAKCKKKNKEKIK